jgi:hypothetical protein
MNVIDPGWLLGVLLMSLVFLALFIVYLWTIQGTLTEINPENRRIKTEHIWLMLIPVFNLYWLFVLVTRVSDSIRAEYEDRGLRLREKRPAYYSGILMSVFLLFTPIPKIGWFFVLPAIVCWLAHWVRVTVYRSKLTGMSDVL